MHTNVPPYIHQAKYQEHCLLTITRTAIRQEQRWIRNMGWFC